MTSILKNILTADDSAVTPIADALRAVRLKLPNARRDELLIALALGGFPLVCSGSETLLVGFRLA